MVRLSNGFVVFINVIGILLSLAVIASSLWFYLNHATPCQKLLERPLLILGLSLLVISVLGLVGAGCRNQFFLWIYLSALFLLILGLIGFTIFAIIVTNKGVGKAISRKGFKEYRLADYSNWLQDHVVNHKNWEDIRSCLVDAGVCSDLGADPHYKDTQADFMNRGLSSVQSGCCKPPTYCKLQFKNATFWTMPKAGPAVPDSDCQTWSNNQQALCYDCKSCKAGVLANIKQKWRYLALFNTGTIVVVVVVYSIGCYALRHNIGSRRPYSAYNYKGYP
ncbi:tetraspanin-8-like [Diospyros lotus]|uniref:tetraspanin-8-like n=1 Tax=Diospyros lotus TaxID=55363 RepID=UPI00224CFADD|nr:tetraspanin-8-like [Diospyros lotus]